MVVTQQLPSSGQNAWLSISSQKITKSPETHSPLQDFGGISGLTWDVELLLPEEEEEDDDEVDGRLVPPLLGVSAPFIMISVSGTLSPY